MSRNEDSLSDADYKKLKGKKVTIVGGGSTGSLIASLLARLQLELKIIDRDVVEAKNLLQQPVYKLSDVGFQKAKTLAKKLSKYTKTAYYFEDLTYRNINLLAKSDLIIDCTDNVETRFLINEYCKKNNLVWIHTAASDNLGTMVLFTKDSACYNCIFENKLGIDCSTGIMQETLKAVSAVASSIAIAYLTKNFASKNSDLIRLNASEQSIVKIKTKKNKKCKVCNGIFEYLKGKRSPIKLCGNNRFMININKNIDLKEISKKLKNIKKITTEAIITKDFTIMKNGRILVVAKSQAEAKLKVQQVLEFENL